MRGSVGYRAGIHMKAYQSRFPVVVIGGTAGDYLGEYMAGGIVAALNVDNSDGTAVGEYVGTGMHGGVIYLRGNLEPHQIGAGVGIHTLDDSDWIVLQEILTEYSADVGLAFDGFLRSEFCKLFPQSTRPYGTVYAY
jgi:glutamate synthase domain-containing protein 3